MAISAKDLIAKKGLLEEEKEKIVSIDVEGVGSFDFRIPTMEDYTDATAKAKKRPNKGIEDKWLVFACCVSPDLSDPELQKAYDCKEPLEIVDKIFLIGVVSKIAQELVRQAGFSDEYVQVVDETKN